MTQWGEWSEWSSCSATCSIGVRERRRECENGAPGDPGCEGDDEEQVACDTGIPCPGTFSLKSDPYKS